MKPILLSVNRLLPRLFLFPMNRLSAHVSPRKSRLPFVTSLICINCPATMYRLRAFLFFRKPCFSDHGSLCRQPCFSVPVFPQHRLPFPVPCSAFPFLGRIRPLPPIQKALFLSRSGHGSSLRLMQHVIIRQCCFSRPRSACPLSIRILSGFLLPVKIRFFFRLPRKSSLPFSPISYYSKPVLRSGCPPSAAFPGHRPARHPGSVCPLKAFRSQKKRPFNKSAFCHILLSKDQSKLYIKTNAKDNTPTAMPPILVMLFSLPSTVLDFILFA